MLNYFYTLELLKKYVDDRGKYLITREHGQVVSI